MWNKVAKIRLFPEGTPPCWSHTIVAIVSGPDPTNRAIQVTLFRWAVSLK